MTCENLNCACLEAPLDVCTSASNSDIASASATTNTITVDVPRGQALDVILVLPSCFSNPGDSSASVPSCSDWTVRFPFTEGTIVRVCINEKVFDDLTMKCDAKTPQCRFVRGHSVKPTLDALQRILQEQTGDNTCTGNNNSKNNSPLSIRYEQMDKDGKLVALATCHLFILHHCDRVIVVDIDGTLTRSNARGAFSTLVIQNYQNHVHTGVCQFLTRLVDVTHYQLVYLTSRPMEFCHGTRTFLHSLRQCQWKLPLGPLFMHPGRLSDVLYSELISSNMHVFKSDVLFRQVILTFVAAGAPHTAVVAAGFGNSITDTIAYEMAGVPKQFIYQINKRSEIRVAVPVWKNQPSTMETTSKEVHQQKQQIANRFLQKRISKHRPDSTILYSRGYQDPDLWTSVVQGLANDRDTSNRAPPSRSNTCLF